MSTNLYEKDDERSSEDDYAMDFQDFMKNGKKILDINDKFESEYIGEENKDLSKELIKNSKKKKITNIGINNSNACTFQIKNGKELLALSTLLNKVKDNHYQYLPCDVCFNEMFSDEQENVVMAIGAQKKRVYNPYQKSKIEGREGRVNSWAEVVKELDKVINKVGELINPMDPYDEGNKQLAQIMLDLYEGNTKTLQELKTKMSLKDYQHLKQTIAEFFTLALVVEVSRFPNAHPYILMDLKRIAEGKQFNKVGDKKCYFDNMFTNIRIEKNGVRKHRFSESNKKYNETYKAEPEESLNKTYIKNDNKEVKKHSKPSGKNIISSAGGYKDARQFLTAIKFCKIYKGFESETHQALKKHIHDQIDHDLDFIKDQIGYGKKERIFPEEFNEIFGSINVLTGEEIQVNQNEQLPIYNNMDTAEKIAEIKKAINNIEDKEKRRYYRHVFKEVEAKLTSSDSKKSKLAILEEINKIRGINSRSQDISVKFWKIIKKKISNLDPNDENIEEKIEAIFNSTLQDHQTLLSNNSKDNIQNIEKGWKSIMHDAKKNVSRENEDPFELFQSKISKDFKVNIQCIGEVYQQIRMVEETEDRKKIHQDRFKYMSPIRMHNSVANDQEFPKNQEHPQNQRTLKNSKKRNRSPEPDYFIKNKKRKLNNTENDDNRVENARQEGEKINTNKGYLPHYLNMKITNNNESKQQKLNVSKPKKNKL